MSHKGLYEYIDDVSKRACTLIGVRVFLPFDMGIDKYVVKREQYHNT